MTDKRDPDDGLPAGQLAEQLSRFIQALGAAGRTVLPGSADALLRSIVEAAAKIFGADAASILLVNEADGTLEFKVACGKSDRDLVGTRIPLDHGIAGYVVMTGQPIAISNVESDPRFNRDFAKSTGYVPGSILATPLVAADRILGVMEVLDKLDAPSFSMQDMELLGMFAHQAALAIDQAQKIEQLGDAIRVSLARLLTDQEPAAGELLAALNTLPDPNCQNDLEELANLMNEFSQLGEAERRTSLKILSAFAEYGRSQRRMTRGAGLR